MKFGALSPELQEKMWKSVVKNYSKGDAVDVNINRSKLYQDYKNIINNSKGSLLFEKRSAYDKGVISDKNGIISDINVSDVYDKKDKYKEMIKLLTEKLKH